MRLSSSPATHSRFRGFVPAKRRFGPLLSFCFSDTRVHGRHVGGARPSTGGRDTFRRICHREAGDIGLVFRVFDPGLLHGIGEPAESPCRGFPGSDGWHASGHHRVHRRLWLELRGSLCTLQLGQTSPRQLCERRPVASPPCRSCSISFRPCAPHCFAYPLGAVAGAQRVQLGHGVVVQGHDVLFGGPGGDFGLSTCVLAPTTMGFECLHG